jgi:predicted transcriptional regulator YdeE
MEQYSHGKFNTTGMVYHIPNHAQEQEVINLAWLDFDKFQLSKLVTNKAYPHLHAIYYNYTNPTDKLLCGYDMLIGYITEDNYITDNPKLKTITIPAQDYRYIKFEGCVPEEIKNNWDKINSMTQQELDRDYGYDLEMYSEKMDSVTIAVSVNKTK